MKRFLCAVLALACLALPGCRQESPVYQDPIRVYYRVLPEKDALPGQIIGWRNVEGYGNRAQPVSILNQYLRTPPGQGFQQTFPAGVRVLRLEMQRGRACVTLSSQFAAFDGIRLTVACACLSKTVMELTGANSVCLTVNNGTLGGNEQIIMDDSNLLTQESLTILPKEEGKK